MKPDKLLHLTTGYSISLTASLFLGWYGLLIAVIIGFGKELFDKYIQDEYFDWGDLFFTVAGVVAGFTKQLGISVIQSYSN